MSFEAAAWAIKSRPNNKSQKLLLIILADAHNTETGRCNPSLRHLAIEGIMTRSTVALCLADLESQGYLTRKKGGVNASGENYSTQYTLNFGMVVRSSDHPPKNTVQDPKTPINKGLEQTKNDTGGGSPTIGLGSPKNPPGWSDFQEGVVRFSGGGSPTIGPKPVINQELTKNNNDRPLNEWSEEQLTEWVPGEIFKKLYPQISTDDDMLRNYRVQLLDWKRKGWLGSINILTKYARHCQKFKLESQQNPEPKKRPRSKHVTNENVSAEEMMKSLAGKIRLN